jgi:DNA primase
MIMQNDLVKLKEAIDCRLLLERDLGKPTGGENSKAWAWKCPVHHESKGRSLTAWVNGWKCWGACGTGGDVVKWYQWFHGMSFTEACHTLGAPDEYVGGSKNRKFYWRVEHSHPALAEPPNQLWQNQAAAVIREAKECLWSKDGQKAFAYLRQQRGLTPMTIDDARLGYIPGDSVNGYVHYKLSDGNRFDVPCGILVPWIIEGAIWNLKVRRGGGPIKYIYVAKIGGSGTGLYGADNLLPGWPVLFVEGEFDALVAWQTSMDLINPVTLGSASNRLNPRWYAKLATANPLLVCYDADKAGEDGAAALSALTARARRVQVPSGKDLTDFYLTGVNVYQWLDGLLSGQSEFKKEIVNG